MYPSLLGVSYYTNLVEALSQWSRTIDSGFFSFYIIINEIFCANAVFFMKF